MQKEYKVLSMKKDELWDEVIEEMRPILIKSKCLINDILQKMENSQIGSDINDKIEKEFVARHINRPLFLSIEDKKTIMTMDPFYVKDYRFFLNNNIEVSGKNIYLLGYDYNIDYYKNTDSKLTRNNSTKTIQLN